MLQDVTLGQFFPGNSVLHRLDPRAKMLLLIGYVAVIFLCDNLLSYLAMIAFLVFCVALSRLDPRVLFKGFKPMLFIMFFTAFLNIFWTPGDPIFSFWVFHVSKDGLFRAGFMFLRILLLISGTFLLTYTTSPLLLTDAMRWLMTPLKVIRVPIHELSMMMTIALRFVPTILEETEKIISAQKARGADFESGNFFKRIKALTPILVPLFVGAYLRAAELATAMECRCYRGGEGRTRMKEPRFGRIDALGALVCVMWFGCIGVLGQSKFLPF